MEIKYLQGFHQQKVDLRPRAHDSPATETTKQDAQRVKSTIPNPAGDPVDRNDAPNRFWYDSDVVQNLFMHMQTLSLARPPYA